MKQITVGDRFWSKVNRGEPEACWVWTRNKTSNGYGAFSWGHSKKVPAHRAAFFITHGRWPHGRKVVLHTCDNPLCCNPAHLREGTQKENVLDCVAKGRMNKPHPRAIGAGNHQAKLTWKIVEEMRALKPRYGLKILLARKYGLSRDTIERVLLNKTWIRV